jgi:uncharacterized membrane protein YdjX (TVP38/TMEM64 family)
MTKKWYNRRQIIVVIFIFFCVLVGFFTGEYVWQKIVALYHIFLDRELTKAFVLSFGVGAPLVFILIQIFQVVLAPVPGEATGFIGGYLFGVSHGFLYSSVGLAAGSCINFSLGRFFGKHYVRRLIPASKLNRLDALVRRQGIIVLFLLFAFPGFPKDYLCLVLGVSTIPFKAFIILASIGRMPGTYMLSLQGASLFEKNYPVLITVSIVCLAFILVAYKYREDLYRWVEKLNCNR